MYSGHLGCEILEVFLASNLLYIKRSWFNPWIDFNGRVGVSSAPGVLGRPLELEDRFSKTSYLKRNKTILYHTYCVQWWGFVVSLYCTVVWIAIDTERTSCFYARQRPYCIEQTRSHPNSEVKRYKARIVLGWVTAREVLWVLLAFFANVNISRNTLENL